MPHVFSTVAVVTFIVAVDEALTIAGNDGLWRLDFADALRIDRSGVKLQPTAIGPTARAAIVAIASPAS